MTEKRFTIDVETENYENAYFENDKFLCYEDDYDAILKRLNELAEENQQIKQRLGHAEKVNTGLIDENHRLRLTLIHSSDLNLDIGWLKENLNKWRDMND